MTDQAPRGRWQRMTDMMGLSDPDRIAKPMNLRLVLILAVTWSVVGIGWCAVVLTDIAHGRVSYLRLVIGVLYLAVAVTYWFMWAQARRRAAAAAKDGEP